MRIIRRVIGDRVEDVPRIELDRANPRAVMIGGILCDNRALTRAADIAGAAPAAVAGASPQTPERYPIPIKITAVGGQDGNGNDLYNVVELDGEGDSLGITHTNVPNLARPAAALSEDDQAEMGYSRESNSFFFSEAS